MNTPINFELAKLLKEKGFDKRVKGFYDTEKELHINYTDEMNTKGFANRHLPKGEYSAPTITEVVMWLYEEHGIWTSVVPYEDEELSQTLWENKTIHISDDYNDSSDYTFYHSPTEAYEAAIEYILKNLI